MPRHLLEFDNPDRFVPGTIGPPGARTFFLQARQGRALVSVSLEKVQMAALAERLRDLLRPAGPRGRGRPRAGARGGCAAAPAAGDGGGADSDAADASLLRVSIAAPTAS